MKAFHKVLGKSVTGLDCSTNSIAYCRMEDGGPVSWGEINLAGTNIYEKIVDARHKVSALNHKLAADVVAIESAVMVKSVQTAIQLAYIDGAILSELLDANKHVLEVAPISWQSLIGNKLWTKERKDAFRRDNPGRTKSWYDTQMRRQRKQVTMDWVYDTYRIRITSDNVGDAFGLAYYADRKLLV